MADPKGFMAHKRAVHGYRPVEVRVKDFEELMIPLTPEDLTTQASRCMDCGIPFCHGFGCPLGNRVPEFNDLVYKGRWKDACDVLHSTNNFPEFTGRVCPAPCETACTLGISDDPVNIRDIELQIIERGFEEGWIRPYEPEYRTNKRIAVIGSGPAGLAAAQQLARYGHNVVVFEKDARPGGLLRYGIPDFKLNKKIIDRRLEQLTAEGIEFQTDVFVGKDVSARYIEKLYDCVCLTMGAGQPRDLDVPGRELGGIYFAMDFLGRQNQVLAGEIMPDEQIEIAGKNVVVIGGGDTGSDCVGTARRLGAKSIHQLEILPKPPESRAPDTPWPEWPRIMRESTSHEEGCERKWSIMTKEFAGENGNVKKLNCVEVDWHQKDGKWVLSERKGSGLTIDAEVVLLAMGFVHVVHEGLVKDFGVSLDERGNIKTDGYQTDKPNVFAAGDTVMGASLVVRALDQGRQAADAIDRRLIA